MKDATTPRSNSSNDGPQRRLDRATSGFNFPSKLHYILGELEKDGLSHVAKWAPHGRCFVIFDRDAFVNQVLRLWFGMTKYASFQRQLNIYGFRRIETGMDQGALYHQMFVRDMPSLVNCIPRLHNKSILKGSMVHQASEAHRRANLDVYRMTTLSTMTATASSSPLERTYTATTRPVQVLQDLVAVALRQEQQRLQKQQQQQQQQQQQMLLDVTIGLLHAHRQSIALVTSPFQLVPQSIQKPTPAAALHRTASEGPHAILGTSNSLTHGTNNCPIESQQLVQDFSRQSLILALLNATSRP